MDLRGHLSGKRIMLGVTGSIASYKAVDILRALVGLGAEVRVAMTKHAAQFVSPLTFEVLSNRPVLVEEYGGEGISRIGHIGITDSLDLALVAPATANIIGKVAAGIADDSLTSALMAADCPLIMAPAMNDRMYRNPRLQKNITALKTLGVGFVEPGTGSLACGTSGMGRLAETDVILQAVASRFTPRDLEGVTVLVTAGPTRERIDAVRFISNASSGKMGYALAVAAHERGAEVILISGPVQLEPPSGVTLVRVESAADMQKAVNQHSACCGIVVMAAAVSDFRPVTAFDRKIKKEIAEDSLALERTTDILHELGRAGRNGILVGFAAETEAIEQNALKKLKEKNLDLIVANDLQKENAGFGTDTNSVIIFDRSGNRTEMPTMPKIMIARYIMQTAAGLLRQKQR